MYTGVGFAGATWLLRSSGYRGQADRRVSTPADIYAGCAAFAGTADSNKGRDRRNRGRRLEGPRSDRSGRRIRERAKP